MYIRTVWVGNFRHAILSHDDPYFINNARKRRPHSSATCASNKLTTRQRSRLSHTDDLEHCLRKFSFVVTNERSTLRPTSSHTPDIEKLDLSDVEPEFEEEFILKANAQPIYDYDTSRSKFDSLNLNMKTLKSNRTARSDVKEDNELSERVIQWLDLAGKVDLLAPNNNERMSQPRHSWPEIQRRNNLTKSKTAIDMRAKDTGKTLKVSDSAKVQQGPIDRHDFYVPASANTIENYARQSRNVKSTPRHETTKTKDVLNKKPKDIRNGIIEARQKLASERDAVEKQYTELLNKKLIPDLKGKKQVHIFMPEMPKKCISNGTSRTESVLTQLSQASHKST